ncbi:Gfo/Idh/MocA family protein [Haloarcula litorea]|uniref:Gfo/Idh/MocA family protein n=1 Tax=Haloarcula litorea TaxID=3032579 RepID=UPI0023E770A4|nr:Gfo/Idh/MocA family oxidoreductase [Halomicroarcula sp. GDY20]
MDCLVVGAGSVAGRYLDALTAAPDLDVAAVCDIDGGRARRAADEYDAAAHDDLPAALDAEPAPLVVNLTGHAAHESVTRTALRADRHVFSEKPLAMDAAAAHELVALAARRGLGLACAPTNPGNPGQRRAARLLADGRLGTVRVAYADAHVGRVTEWHDDPGAFLEAGPLWDGGVYPLTLLVAWFGPVERVRSADAAGPWPDRADRGPTADSHVDAVLDHRDGPRVRLTASLYTPHRGREFYGVELHGDDGSLYLDDAGAQADAADRVRVGRSGREYAPAPPQFPEREGSYADGPAALARSVRRGDPDRGTARRGAHVAAVCEAVERAAETGEAAEPPARGATATPTALPVARPPPSPPSAPASLRLPRVGVAPPADDRETAERALDAGCRLLVVDPAAAATVGDALSAHGAPTREAVHVAGRVPWRTPVDAAVERLLTGLGGGALDSLLVADARAERWDAAESARDRGDVRVLGEAVESAAAATRRAPLVAAGSPPSESALSAHRERGCRVLLTVPSPSALVDGAATAVARTRDTAPERVAVARAVGRGLVPVVEREAVETLAGAGLALSADERRRLAGTDG